MEQRGQLDFRFEFKLRCRSCKAAKALKLPAYPHPIGSNLPTSYGPDAHCIRCGRAEMEILNNPPEPPPPPPPVGWAKDPRGKR